MASTIKFSPGHQKLMLLFPVPVVLCLLLVFHGLAGGKDSAGNPRAAAAQGINTTLPPAKTDSAGKAPDKVQIYALAAADSERFREQQKQDPNLTGRPVVADTALHNAPVPARVIPTAVDQRRLAADATAAKLLAKIQQLQKELDNSAGDRSRSAASDMARPVTPEPDQALGRLGAFTQAVQDNPKIERDPEMERIDAMLDKLIRIQHPDLVVSDTTKSPSTLRAFALEPQGQKAVVANFQRGAPAVDEEEEAPAGFIDIGEEDKPDTASYNREAALEAIVDGNQTVTSGSTVALRLVNGGVVNGLPVPSGQQLYGEASMTDQRLMIHIPSLRIGDQVMPVSIRVYDLDGLAGIRVPDAVTREVSKESASEAVSGLGLASMDPSLTGQAANAGLQLARTLTSRKIRTVRVQLPAGYQVLLVNTKTK